MMTSSIEYIVPMMLNTPIATMKILNTCKFLFSTQVLPLLGSTAKKRVAFRMPIFIVIIESMTTKNFGCIFADNWVSETHVHKQ